MIRHLDEEIHCGVLFVLVVMDVTLKLFLQSLKLMFPW
jgi:hypothetical protein